MGEQPIQQRGPLICVPRHTLRHAALRVLVRLPLPPLGASSDASPSLGALEGAAVCSTPRLNSRARGCGLWIALV